MNEFNFGENLRIIRQAKGISQEAMSIGLNISQAKYSRLERRHTIPSLDLVKKICIVLQEEPPLVLSGRRIQDLMPKAGFEQQAKDIMNTTEGVVFFWMLVIPFINAAYDMGHGFCEGLGTSEGVQRAVRILTGVTAIGFAFYWMKRVRKGKQ